MLEKVMKDLDKIRKNLQGCSLREIYWIWVASEQWTLNEDGR